MIEKREEDSLSTYAMPSSQSEGRPIHEEEDPVRTCFQRDRDRILHSKPFRRLKHKTQVFLDPVGDHYRTRLTHSLEVSQIARTIGRALRLNEDLVEAIAIGHDVGHTPFGHAGEAALDAALQKLSDEQLDGVPRKFRHYEQSLRIYDVLTPLNLSQEVRQGIDGHSKGKSDLSSHDGQAVSTLEAAVVRISDRIAYLNHDLDDAVRSGMIKSVPEQFLHLGSSHGDRIAAMVIDTIEQSLNQPAIRMSDDMLGSMNSLKDWLFENVYEQYPRVYPDIDKAKRLVTELLHYYLEPGTLPAGFEGARGALDYVAGMTDRFAVETYANLFIPSSFNERIGRIR